MLLIRTGGYIDLQAIRPDQRNNYAKKKSRHKADLQVFLTYKMSFENPLQKNKHFHSIFYTIIVISYIIPRLSFYNNIIL